ncbi:FAD-dependent oxidoreductase [Telmatospirillum sp.]|uniref:NAD(P)/FAD-dependent oxidoreductase n=1 Tax=Telmatospirillum sp. TaxID=2079197 RepID=UPI00284FA8F7|nr:FAD-dependent oxidoreductase [Telmatospirillum sp.]MDR3435385.1 FAD-dependent oxidoreductase [Telmatospirillum sp.]
MSEGEKFGEVEIAIVGGGITGASLAWGLSRLGKKVLVLDEGDVAFRASRGNFALIWVQLKGLGFPAYAHWTNWAADAWPGFAQTLSDQTGIDIAFRRSGGLTLALSDDEMEKQAKAWARLREQPDMPACPHERLDHDGIGRLLPDIGPDVVGGFYCPRDGHVNVLRLFAALHRGLALSGVDYRADHRVDAIVPDGTGFRLSGAWGEVGSAKVVLAAGLGNAVLASMIGLTMPVRPVGGHVMVTEKARPFLRYPTTSVRQTDDGGVMIGTSQEERGFDTSVSPAVLSTLAERAIRTFPLLGRLNVVRSWSALRIMTPDGFPIYDRSLRYPGAFGATCHSGVTLAPAHALRLASWIAEDGSSSGLLDVFRGRRFDVPALA